MPCIPCSRCRRDRARGHDGPSAAPGYARAMMKRLAGLAAIVALLALPSIAGADSGGATIRSLPESQELQVSAAVHHECPGFLSQPTSSCAWFAGATQYPAGTECPITFDDTHSVWVGPLETVPGTTYGTFAFRPTESTGAVHVCLFVFAEGSSLVGQSHPFNLDTGTEVLPPPPSPPPSPEPSLSGLRYCERPALNGAFLSASPDVKCRTARAVRGRLFRNPCQNRTYCVVMGFRCYGRWGGHARPFSYAHHASCRSKRRRIVLDIG
jgi:hypothetical protein